MRTSYYLPFAIWGYRFSIDGSEDLVTATSSGVDQNRQPDIVMDVGRLVGYPPRGLVVGVELFNHDARDTRNCARASRAWDVLSGANEVEATDPTMNASLMQFGTQRLRPAPKHPMVRIYSH